MNSTIQFETSSRRRLRLKKTEISVLNDVFEENSRPEKEVLMELSQRFGVSVRYLSRWFQNKRTREKRRRTLADEMCSSDMLNIFNEQRMQLLNLQKNSSTVEQEEIPLSPFDDFEHSSSAYSSSTSISAAMGIAPPSLAVSAATSKNTARFASQNSSPDNSAARMPSQVSQTKQSVQDYNPEFIDPEYEIVNAEKETLFDINENMNIIEELAMMIQMSGGPLPKQSPTSTTCAVAVSTIQQQLQTQQPMPMEIAEVEIPMIPDMSAPIEMVQTSFNIPLQWSASSQEMQKQSIQSSGNVLTNNPILWNTMPILNGRGNNNIQQQPQQQSGIRRTSASNGMKQQQSFFSTMPPGSFY